MLFAVLFLYSICSSQAIVSSLFRSAERHSSNEDWLVEPVQVIPLDDGQWQHGSRYLSYMIYRENVWNNASSFILDLQLNTHFNPSVPIEYDREEIDRTTTNCSFYGGSVRHWGQAKSMVAISICSGLAGLIHHTQDGVDYFLEPTLDDNEQSHILTYRVNFTSNASGIWSCGVNSSTNHSQTTTRRRTRRSVIRGRFIETLLVADASVTEFFAHPHVTELYLLTMMNMVNSIYGHASLGYPVEIVLTRIIMLSNQSDFQMASRSHETLHNFCAWQERLKKGTKTSQSIHHDVAVFLTRKSLCHENASCSTIGLAHMAGMCMVNRSCNINQDIGLISAYTIAHEIGHNLGMHHDGDKGHCSTRTGSSNGDTIMVPSYAKVPSNMWSPCSRDNLTDYFDQGWAKCLNNKPAKIQPFDDMLPGVIFDLDEQCRLAMGPASTSCFHGDEPPIDVCAQMMCTRLHEGRSICISTLTNQPADGTLCGPNKWCFHGRCTPMSYRAETPPIHGGWSPWTPWSSCSHTCGLGVEYQYRTCTKPKPDFGGKHCLGVRKRYRTCTMTPCKKSLTHQSHETHLNCNELNAKSNGTKWKTVSWFAPVPCMVFCTPILSSVALDNETSISSNITVNGDEVGKIESIKFRDGTQCTIDDENNEDLLQHRGMCITGQCQKLGCDNQLYSTAVEDECGVCNGNRSACQKINKVWQYQRQDTTPAGSYVKVGTVSSGIVTFQIEKNTQASSFLAIRVKDRYYLNGDRSITESSVFQIGKTHLWYKRESKHEVLEGRGHPLLEDVDIMILILNSDLIKIKYLYWELANATESSHSPLDHHYSWAWENGTNDDCSCVTRQAHCTFRSAQNESIVVSDNLCDAKSKPPAVKCRASVCSDQSLAAPRWQVGAWRNCEGRCSPQEALQRRSLLCVRTLPNNRTHTIPTSICLHWLSSIPATVRECPADLSSAIPKCTSMKTYSRWTTGDWIGNCSSVNPCSMQYRPVTCLSHDPNAICTADDKLKPNDRRPCNETCGEWVVSHWSSSCSGTCDNASIHRNVSCSTLICDLDRRPLSMRRCILPHCTNGSTLTTNSPSAKITLTKIIASTSTSKEVLTSLKTTLSTTTKTPATKESAARSTTKALATKKKVATTTTTKKKLVSTTTRSTRISSASG